MDHTEKVGQRFYFGSDCTVRLALHLQSAHVRYEGDCLIAPAIDLIRNYGPGTRDGASGFDRAAGTVASCSFVVEDFDR